MLGVLSQFIFLSTFNQWLPQDMSQIESLAGIETAIASPLYEEEFQLFLPAAENVSYPKKVDPDSLGIVTTARSAIVTDAESGMVLLAKHPDQQRSIGSVTKLMSAMVFLDENPDLNRYVSLDPAQDLVEGGRIYLRFYEETLLEEILAASIVGSDNTATKALGRFINLSDEEFVEKMNQKAQALGMDMTEFTDPTGIDALNISTARDLLILLEEAEKYDELRYYMRMSEISVQQANYAPISIQNTNILLESFLNEGEFSVEGGKTGFLPQAGYVLATSIEKNGNLIHVIVLGSESKETRALEVKGLASWAFNVYSWD